MNDIIMCTVHNLCLNVVVVDDVDDDVIIFPR